MSDILDQILARKRQEVAERRRRQSEPALLADAAAQSPPRGFRNALSAAIADDRPGDATHASCSVGS